MESFEENSKEILSLIVYPNWLYVVTIYKYLRRTLEWNHYRVKFR